MKINVVDKGWGILGDIVPVKSTGLQKILAEMPCLFAWCSRWPHLFKPWFPLINLQQSN